MRPDQDSERRGASDLGLEMNDPEQILGAIIASRSFPANAKSSSSLSAAPRQHVAPRTPMEKQLVQVWSELLRKEPIGVLDDFFDVGGHSLIATQILTRVREIYGVELSLEILFEGDFTIAELARHIRHAQIKAAGVQEATEAMQALESLTEEQVHSLLNQQTGFVEPPTGRYVQSLPFNPEG